MKNIFPRTIFALMFLVAGCASEPPHYHTLVPPLAEGKKLVESEVDPGALSRVVRVDSVQIPPQLNRFELVIRGSDGGIGLSENELWIAPLADELKSALSLELERRLASASGEGGARNAPPLSVRIDVERFESAPSRYAFIEASWQIREIDARTQSTLVCRTTARQSVGAGYGALVRGHQRAVILIADQIAAAVLRLHSTDTATCPQTEWQP
jgi:uncharacterized lipoprotein YmbA